MTAVHTGRIQYESISPQHSLLSNVNSISARTKPNFGIIHSLFLSAANRNNAAGGAMIEWSKKTSDELLLEPLP